MDSDTASNDIELARVTYHGLLSKGAEALDDMMDVARATEHPRAYEVLSTMMKTLADINGNLVDLHKKKKDIEKKDDPVQQVAGQTTNNLFVGSTAELQKLLLNDMRDVTPVDDK